VEFLCVKASGKQNTFCGLNASLFWTLFVVSDIILAPLENWFQSAASDGILWYFS